MISKNTPTFYKDGKRRVKCPHCHKYVGFKGGRVLETKLSDKKIRNCRCCHCKGIFILYPPVKTTDENGYRVIKWGPNLSYTTADLTDREIEDTIE
jgi:hypothetical protein